MDQPEGVELAALRQHDALGRGGKLDGSAEDIGRDDRRGGHGGQCRQAQAGQDQ